MPEGFRACQGVLRDCDRGLRGEGLSEITEGLPEGPEGLPEGSLGLSKGLLGKGWMDGCTEFFPILQGSVPYSDCTPKTEEKQIGQK